ncbi:MAG: cytochrome c [Pyrinomonadaceae bacterium]
MSHFLLPAGIAVALVLASITLALSTEAHEAHNTSARSAAELYSKHCASCHGKDGRAKTFKAKLNHARDLTDAAWQGNVSDERIFNSIMSGKRKMPSYAKKMSEQEIDSLVGYVRGLKR